MWFPLRYWQQCPFFWYIALLLMQSFMVSQSHRNSIWLCGLRSELASFGLILSRFRLGGLHSDFCLIAILGQLKAFGCNLSELCQDCLNPAIDPQFTGLHQDCKEPENSVSGIARHLEDSPVQGPQPDDLNRNLGVIGVGTNLVRSEHNPSELRQDCSKSRIQSQSSGLQISRSRLREDCDNPKELVLGIAGHREDCRESLSNLPGLPSSLGSNLTDSR